MPISLYNLVSWVARSALAPIHGVDPTKVNSLDVVDARDIDSLDLVDARDPATITTV